MLRGICFLSAVCLSAAIAHGGIVVGAESTQIMIEQGQTVEVDIVLDADDQQPGNQAVASGLFSMKMAVEIDEAKVTLDSVDLPAALDDNGLGGGPDLQFAMGVLEIRAALPASFSFADIYKGEDDGMGGLRMRLATLTLTGVAQGSSSLTTSLLRDFPTDDVFITGDFEVLDEQISFGSSSVQVVIPEPASLSLLMMAFGIVGRLRRDAIRRN